MSEEGRSTEVKIPGAYTDAEGELHIAYKPESAIEEEAQESAPLPYKMEDFEEKPPSPLWKGAQAAIVIVLLLFIKSFFFSEPFADRFFAEIMPDLNRVVAKVETEFIPQLDLFMEKLENDKLTRGGIHAEIEDLQAKSGEIQQIFIDSEASFPFDEFSSTEQERIRKFYKTNSIYYEDQNEYIGKVEVCLDMVLDRNPDAYSYCYEIDEQWNETTLAYAEQITKDLELTAAEKKEFMEGFYEGMNTYTY